MTEVEEQIFIGDVGVSVCTNKIVKMKQRVTFCSEFSILCIEDIELLLTVLSSFQK